MGVMLIASALSTRGVRVIVCRHGLIQLDLESVNVCRWSDIESVTERRSATGDAIGDRIQHESVVFSLLCSNGREIILRSNLVGIAALGAHVQDRTLDLLCDQCLAELKDKGVVRFGVVRLDDWGITVDGDPLPWRELKKVAIQNAHLALYRHGKLLKWKQVPIWELPNVHVVPELIRELRQR